MKAMLFDDVRKDAVASDLHVPTALGNQRTRRKHGLFRAFLAGSGHRPVEPVDVTDSVGKKDELHKKGWMPSFLPMDDESSHTPFPYDPNGLSNLRPTQVPKFLSALTDQKKLPIQTVRLSGLVALQDRVNTEHVGDLRGKDTKPGLVVRANGRHYIADGHHRLAARLLDGHGEADVHFLDLHQRGDVHKSNGLEIPFEFIKADEDKRLVFGWASIVEKDGQMVVDHQTDIIPVHELEDAAYDYVLKYRTGSDMHSRMDCSRLVESMVFTKEKQKAMGIDLGMQGWWTGFKVDDDALWADYKAGNRPEFSIGGSAQRIDVS